MKTVTVNGVTKKVKFSIIYTPGINKKGTVSNHIAVIDGIQYPIQVQIVGNKDTFIYK